ncbi:Multidrug resistance protein MdtH [Nonomuraea coxensis DSM 45129]|uniref:Multidrug resistance protein MdtH n=1 Tax=Nonomuraea coxensis DSM 45129 TaxID=1122611 RepID=A0ABX8U9N1_9ACTN|nr:MFS transporter [Nonomuraea coxensis]QYC44235.1 Multidrug resistance protein MdtH [Nonomuraea coxensis DSM 45129]
MRWARNWIGLPDVPAARRWAWVAVIDAVGTGMRIPVTVIYLTAVVGLDAASVGIGLGLAALAGTLCAPACGALIDRYGPKPMVVACFLTAAAGYLGYLAIQDWVSFIVVAIVAEIAEHSGRPAKQALVASMVTAEQRVKLMAFQRSIRNVGFGLGGLTSAALLTLDAHSGYYAVLAGDALSFLVAAALVSRIAVTRPSPRPAAQAGPGRRDGFRDVLADRRYVALAVLNTLVMTHVTALNVGVPLWVNQHTTAPPGLVGVLFALNTALVVLLQVRLTKGVARAADTPPVYVRATAAFAVAAAGYWAASMAGGTLAFVVVLLVVAMLAHTAAELYGAVGEWTVSVDLAPEHLRGRYLSLFHVSFSAHQAVGPVLVILLITKAPDLAWFVLAAVLGAGCLASAWLARGAGEPAATKEVSTTP